jgi:hypothetical protein
MILAVALALAPAAFAAKGHPHHHVAKHYKHAA